MEPMLPEEAERGLDDLTLELVAAASKLAGRVHPLVQASVGDLVRSMNCYYSNLIEGHDTHPRDIDRAMAQDFSAEPRQRALQLEAVAHIEVQRLIDTGADGDGWPGTNAYACWLHRELCSRLPDELLIVENPKTGEQHRVCAGSARMRDVVVGRHRPPEAMDVPRFMRRFDEAYAPKHLSQLRRIQAIGPFTIACCGFTRSWTAMVVSPD